MKDIWLKLIARVMNAELRSLSLFQKWQRELFRRAPELHDRFETEVQIRAKQEPFERIRDPAVRDWVIALKWQNDLLREEITQMRAEQHAKEKQEYEEQYDEPWGAGFLEVFAKVQKDPTQKAQIEKCIQQLWRDLKAQKKRKRMAELDRRRHRKPRDRSVGGWFSPMTQQDYSRACGVNVKTIQRFLAEIDAKPLPSETHGRGRPVTRYGFEVNLKVLEHLLEHWLGGDPAAVLEAIVDTTVWLTTCADPDARHSQVRPLLHRHLRRNVKTLGRATNAEDLEWIKYALTASDTVWSRRVCPSIRAALEAEDNKVPHLFRGR